MTSHVTYAIARHTHKKNYCHSLSHWFNLVLFCVINFILYYIFWKFIPSFSSSFYQISYDLRSVCLTMSVIFSLGFWDTRRAHILNIHISLKYLVFWCMDPATNRQYKKKMLKQIFQSALSQLLKVNMKINVLTTSNQSWNSILD